MTYHYGLLYIIPINATEKKIQLIIDKINELLKKFEAKKTRDDEWTKKKLAYPIKQVRQGFFVSSEFDSDAKNIEKIRKELLLFPEILRFEITKEKIGAYEAKHVPREERPAKEKELQIFETVPEKREVISKPKTGRPKINLEDLDKKLDKILEEEI